MKRSDQKHIYKFIIYPANSYCYSVWKRLPSTLTKLFRCQGFGHISYHHYHRAVAADVVDHDGDVVVGTIVVVSRLRLYCIVTESDGVNSW